MIDEQKMLEQYASVTQTKILSTQADLGPKDSVMREMLSWCRQNISTVVLDTGVILSSVPGSRQVQNCKVVMQNKGLVPGRVYPATATLVQLLLEKAGDAELEEEEALSVSAQQTRLRLLVKEAIHAGTSDIHFEIRENVARILFRKHGELFLHAEWVPSLARQVVSVAFNKETDQASTHFNPLVPQNAAMPLKLEKDIVRLRLASLPAHRGFDVVMRLLASTAEKAPSLEALGYGSDQVQIIKKAIKRPSGAVIVAGPTGSGKTTTLASCMDLVSRQRKIYTVEDPVEKFIENATQVPVNTEQYDRTFASMARTVLRMDPDVIVMGEMRDEDTAAVLVRAAITGHLVFSTLHTNSAADIITRLADLGIAHSLLASPDLLTCLICQRLVPKLCEHCAIPATQSPAHQGQLAQWRSILGEASFDKVRVRGQNCHICYNLGISGRTVVSEVIWVDGVGRRFIQTGDTLGWVAHLKTCGWRSYRDHLLDLVREGVCDPLDAEKLVGELSAALDKKEVNYQELAGI